MDVQVTSVTRKTVESVAATGAAVVVFDGTEPLARISPMVEEMRARAGYFLHFPHDSAECFYSCWRHPRPVLSPVATRSGSE